MAFYPAHPSNYDKGRVYNGRKTKAKKITLHHMASRMTARDCGRIFQRPNHGASAHYGVGVTGDVAQYIKESDTAWSDGNWKSNCESISIEVSNSRRGGDWLVSDESLKATIRLVARIAERNNMGKLVAGKNLTWHSMYAPTLCCGSYLRGKIKYIADEANKINAKANLLKVDGKWGKATTRRTQGFLKVYVDGIVSNQLSKYRKYLPNADSRSWDFDSKGEGGSAMVIALKKFLNRNSKHSDVKITGYVANGTISSLQVFLQQHNLYSGKITGRLDSATVKGWQKYLNKRRDD